MSEIQSNPETPSPNNLVIAETATAPERKQDTMGEWYKKDRVETKRKITSGKEILQLWETTTDSSLRESLEQHIGETTEEIHDLEFYLQVQEQAQQVDRSHLEELHPLYGEGAARMVYNAIYRRDIQQPWVEAIDSYNDGLGVSDAVCDFVENRVRDIDEFYSIAKNREQRRACFYDDIVRVIQDSLRNLPHPVLIQYGKENETIRFTFQGKQKEIKLMATGFHGTLIASPEVDNTLGFYLYERQPDEVSLIGLSESLIRNEPYTNADRINHILTLIHEAGHKDELEQETAGIHSETRLKKVFATEYYSTLLCLKVSKYLYEKTGDKRFIELSGVDAALYNLVVFGDPHNYIDRLRQKAATKAA